MTAAVDAKPTIDDVCADLTRDLLNALGNLAGAKADFAGVTASYTRPDVDPVAAERRAANDPRRRQAAADCAWWQGEAMLAAAALTALRMEQAARRETLR